MLPIGNLGLIIMLSSLSAFARDVSTLKHGGENRETYRCPAAETVAPCLCAKDHGNVLVMDCSKVESDEQLAMVFQQATFPFKDFGHFYVFENENITQFGGDIFNGVTFQNIYLNNVPNLEYVSESWLHGSRDIIANIFIGNSKLNDETFPISQIESFTNISIINFDDSAFDAIPIIKSSSLEYIAFTAGSISSLAPGT